MDSSDDEALGPSPMELVVLAAGCCTAVDVANILRKMHQPTFEMEVEIEAQRAAEHPRVLKSIEFRYRLAGKGLEEGAVRRAVDLSHERYCSVGVMLRRAGVEISTDIRIDEAHL